MTGGNIADINATGFDRHGGGSHQRGTRIERF